MVKTGQFISSSIASSSALYAIYAVNKFEIITPSGGVAVGGHFQFLTFLSLVITLSAFFLSTLHSVFSGPNLLKSIKNLVFVAATVAEFIVTTVYWGIRFYDHNLMFRGGINPIPITLDLQLHAFPLLFLLLNNFLFIKSWGFISKKAGFVLFGGLTIAYWYWIHYLQKFNGMLPYPFLSEVETKERVYIFIVISLIGYSSFLLFKTMFK